jgi:serine/threonine-protein kinase
VGLAQGLIHRDIKPANILLPHDGGVKIVDLGLALGSSEEDDVAPAARHSIVGTYGYMSPEQAQDPQRVDFRADIYALGVTLYEAATASLPFSARDPARCLDMHRHDPVPDPRVRAPELPDALCALLLKMLAKRPEDRPPSYEALEEALRRALGTDATTTADHARG